MAQENENIIKPVFLDADKCNGCVSCMKRCPTEAIRVRNGKATIMYERCVGCGECVRVCPTRAKVEYYDKFETINSYKYKVALPCPSIYGQFNNLKDTNYILNGLKKIGFDDVVEVALGAEIISKVTREYIKNADVPKPIISSACPAIVNLILLRYEHLVEYLSPFLQPEEVAANLAREKAIRETGLASKDIGIFIISPCAANVLELKRTYDNNNIDGVLSFKELYFSLLSEMNKLENLEDLAQSGRLGISWGSTTGECVGIGTDNYLSADGIENVIGVLNEMEHEKLSKLDFIELNTCISGCVGGSLNIENPFLARTRLRILRNTMHIHDVTISQDIKKYMRSEPYQPKNVFKLSEDRLEAMRKVIQAKEIYNKLPQLDCGACGAPCCMALAEDIVNGLNVKCKYQKENV